MNEEENIGEENSKEQLPKTKEEKVSNNISLPETIASTETQITTSDIQNMEVHKHPHHVMHPKRWHEYLLEFLMLFLAVFLGFVAENIRENVHNREIEKTNIESFLKNLYEDSLNLVRTSQVNEKRFLYLDSLMDLKNSSVSDTVFQQYFVYYDLKLGYDDYFQSNQTTFDQMESSGTLRLISHAGVLDSILNYEAEYKLTKKQEDVCAVWWYKSIEQVSLIFDWTPIAHLPADALWQLSLDDIPNIPLSTINRHSPVLQLYFNWQVSERISLGYYITDLHKQLSYNRILISYLKKEYKIK
ncbi:MAG TPA: hypothetical protein VN958_08645 [Chitinophagaceae bacterium]|nr:hypothetical protein [Chitinophagaceae bacterium]